MFWMTEFVISLSTNRLSILLYNGYRLSFPGVKRPGRGFDYPLHLAPRSKKEYNSNSTFPMGLRGLLQGEFHLLSLPLPPG
jgi:hypothetical protein